MTVALVTPTPRQTFFQNLLVAPGAKLSYFVAGSATPATTWSNADLASIHENTFPIVASAGGLFGPIYLQPGVQYDVVLTDANDVTIWSQPDIGTGGIASSVFNIVDYGAVPGGAVDNHTAIQAAIAAASAAVGGGTVFIPSGTWRVLGQLACSVSSVCIAGEGASSILVFDDTALFAALKIAIPSTDTIVTSLLAADTAIGDRTITLIGGGGATMAAGGWIYVADSFADHGSFITYIESILGDVLTLMDAVPCVLTTAQAAVASYRPAGVLKRSEIRDLRVTCASAAPTNMGHLVAMVNVHGPVVRNVQTSGCRDSGILLGQCDDGLIEGCLTEDAITTTGTGANLFDSTNCKIVGHTSRRVQFGITTAKSPKSSITGCQIHGRQTQVALGRGIKLANGSNFGSVSGCVISDTNLFGIYFQDSSHCTATGNTVLSTGAAASTLEHGITVAGFQDDLCGFCAIVGNVLDSCQGYGVAVVPTILTVAKDLYPVVMGNTMRNCKSGAILIFGANRAVVQGNVILQDPATLLLAGAIVLGSSAALVNIQNNAIFSTGAALNGIDTALGAGNSTILNNVLGPSVTMTPLQGDTVFAPTNVAIATVFETAARFGAHLNGGGGNTFNANGAVLATSATINSSAGVDLLLEPAGGSAFTGNPRLSAELTLTLKGTDGQIMVSLGGFTITGTVLTLTEKHAGFKIVWAASGAASLFATQGDGTTETASSALTTVAQGDVLDLLVQLNGSASGEYRWRKNGSVWSPPVFLTTNVPAGAGALVSYLQAALCNSNVASASTVTMTSMAYSR